MLDVRDPERSRRFYRDVLGFRELGRSADLRRRRRRFPAGARTTSCCSSRSGPLPPGRRLGMYHFGLKIGESDEELRTAIEELTDAGVTVTGTADHTVTHILYILDPDGHEIDLYIDVRPSARAAG